MIYVIPLMQVTQHHKCLVNVEILHTRGEVPADGHKVRDGYFVLGIRCILCVWLAPST